MSVLTTIEVLPTAHLATAYDPDGTVVAKPANRHAKGFSEVAAMTHAAFTETDGIRKHLFEIGEPTEKGFKYNWESLAVSTAKVLGARGGVNATPAERKAILGRLAEAYEMLGKSFPTYKTLNQPMHEVPAWKLEDIAFAEVTFSETESNIVKSRMLTQDLTNVLDALKKGDVTLKDTSKGEELLKYIYGSVNLSLYVSLDDPDETEFFTNIVQCITAFQQADAIEDAGELAGVDYALSFYKFEGTNETIYAKGGLGKKGYVYTQGTDGWSTDKSIVAIPETAVKIKNLDRANVVKALAKGLDTYTTKVNESTNPVHKVAEVSPELSDFVKSMQEWLS